ncbi:hypothetical protein [Treponema sp. R80B11-R83G3]
MTYSTEFTDIRGTQLIQVKEKGKVVCPFVQNGHHYFIGVSVDTANNENSPNWTNVEITANVQYDSQKYRYAVTIKVDNNGSIGYHEGANNKLTWEFMPKMIEDFKRDNIEISGNLPAYVTAYCNINFDDLLWIVGVVTSKEFMVSL